MLLIDAYKNSFNTGWPTSIAFIQGINKFSKERKQFFQIFRANLVGELLDCYKNSANPRYCQ